ncbi:MAG TPA: DNA adenine methylase [Spirochaetia bacterium]|nr:DNA adenine methylase [Spirochaetia bacterium]
MSSLPEEEYLSRQLIAYIGNKRRLLGFLRSAFAQIEERGPVRSFMDPFCGSGAVARLARAMGYSVQANDWEMYAWVVTAAHLLIGRSDADELFRERGGIERVFSGLNDVASSPLMEGGSSHEAYIGRYYAPEETETADYRRERLFYTAENGRFIDRARWVIEEQYPGWDLDERARKEKLLLVSSLIYEAATHANTSGVFKAFHKGFGGFGRDALGRILSPMKLEVPVLIDSSRSCGVDRRDAADFIPLHTADLCYLDPPYNQHQYGSNYHLLNTIALWDAPSVDHALTADGSLKERAAIRKDWVKTRSSYCIPSRAAQTLRDLLERIDARFIALSYNTEGFVSIEELYEMLSRQGRTEIMGTDYVLYRGGRQSVSRGTYNYEFLVICDRKSRPQGGDLRRVEGFLLRKRLDHLLKESYVPERVRERFRESDGSISLTGGELSLRMPFLHYFTRPLSEAEASDIPTESVREIIAGLEECRCRDRREEAAVLLSILRTAEAAGTADARDELPRIEQRLLRAVRKIAHRKYHDIFRETCGKVRAFAESAGLDRLLRRLGEIEALAERRFSGGVHQEGPRDGGPSDRSGSPPVS